LWTEPVDLTTEGTLDWSHPSTQDSKYGATIITQGVNGDFVATATPAAMSWVDGTVAPESSSTQFSVTNTQGVTRTFAVSATNTTRRLHIYWGYWSAAGSMTLSLSDNSAAEVVYPIEFSTSSSWHRTTVDFRSGTEDQTLTIEVVRTNTETGQLKFGCFTLTDAV